MCVAKCPLDYGSRWVLWCPEYNKCTFLGASTQADIIRSVDKEKHILNMCFFFCKYILYIQYRYRKENVRPCYMIQVVTESIWNSLISERVVSLPGPTLSSGPCVRETASTLLAKIHYVRNALSAMAFCCFGQDSAPYDIHLNKFHSVVANCLPVSFEHMTL